MDIAEPDNDGSVVTYQSKARNLVEGDQSGQDVWQIYVVSPGTVTTQTDTTAPTIDPAATSPVKGAQVSSPVTFSGSAADDFGVKAVYIQVRDSATGLWLRPDGTWGTGARRLSTSLSAPQQRTTKWSTVLSLPKGKYGFDVQAVDLSGNGSTKPWSSFTVVG